MIALEELGSDFEDRPVNIAADGQVGADFGRVSANGRIPALVDPDPDAVKRVIRGEMRMSFRAEQRA